MESTVQEEKYLHCKEYLGHPLIDKMNRVAFFKNDSEYYFVFYKEDKKVLLRSEGFQYIDERDKILSKALRHFKDLKCYSILRVEDLFIRILKDDVGREIGRSCLEKEEAGSKSGTANTSIDTIKTNTSVHNLTELNSAGKSSDEEFIECKYYLGHPICDKENRVAFFQHNTQYYFVIYYTDGRVRLRSRGFQKSSQRDYELTSALRYLDDKSQYEIVSENNLFIRILKDDVGREIGRSCLEKLYQDSADLDKVWGHSVEGSETSKRFS